MRKGRAKREGCGSFALSLEVLRDDAVNFRMTEVIGWSALALVGVAFLLIFKFINSPSKKLERLIGDGSMVGVTRVQPDSPDWQRLEEFLPSLAKLGNEEFKLGAVYKTGSQDGYLFSAVRKIKSSRSGGNTTRLEHVEKLVWFEGTSFRSSFTVLLQQEVNAAARLAFAFLEKMGGGPHKIDQGLTEEFKEYFTVYATEVGSSSTLPVDLQRFLTQHARGAGYEWGLNRFLDGSGGLAISPGGFVINISQTKRPKKPEHIRNLLSFADGLQREIRA